MKVVFKEIEVSTRSRTELVDVTGSVEEAVNRSEIADGLCIVHTVHSTAAIIVNEHEAASWKTSSRRFSRPFRGGQAGYTTGLMTMPTPI